MVVEAGNWPRRPSPRTIARRAVAAAATGVPVALAPESEVAVVFTDDDHIRVLNRKFRRKNRPTNVLSFPAAPRVGSSQGPLLGDIVLALETISWEAAEQGLTFADHLTHLIVHGFLHLIGYDHMTGPEAVAMEGLETAILATLGIADPYAA